MRKVPKKRLPRLLLVFGLLAMLLITFTALDISSIVVMLTAGMISLAVFAAKGGAGK